MKTLYFILARGAASAMPQARAARVGSQQLKEMSHAPFHSFGLRLERPGCLFNGHPLLETIACLAGSTYRDFHFEVRESDSKGVLTPRTRFGEALTWESRFRTFYKNVAPGEQFNARIRLNRVFELIPGEYTLTVSCKSVKVKDKTDEVTILVEKIAFVVSGDDDTETISKMDNGKPKE